MPSGIISFTPYDNVLYHSLSQNNSATTYFLEASSHSPSRIGGLMSRSLSLCFVLCLSSFALASSVQVVYVAQGTSIVTYNVDPQNLNYTQGGTLSNAGVSTFGTVVPSPNDHFI